MLLRLAIVAAVVGGAALLGWLWRRRDGRVRAAAAPTGTAAGLDAGQLAAVGLDLPGADTLGLLIGTPTCGPCATVRHILAGLADDRPGFRWRYVDAGDHPDLVESQRVRRVPTLLLLDRHGRLLARTAGVPAVAELADVLDRTGDLQPAA